ncbi:hypothetical protein ACFOD4_10865 [Pseudoroseomonas globiformis]|uniref:Uncharacterized protein n=1 Tax=Teichococcus globiformis TaxID=2307229 RepID=A0ABV7FZC5_9PROT
MSNRNRAEEGWTGDCHQADPDGQGAAASQASLTESNGIADLSPEHLLHRTSVSGRPGIVLDFFRILSSNANPSLLLFMLFEAGPDAFLSGPAGPIVYPAEYPLVILSLKSNLPSTWMVQGW